MTKPAHFFLLPCALLLFLNACGGGGSGADSGASISNAGKAVECLNATLFRPGTSYMLEYQNSSERLVGTVGELTDFAGMSAVVPVKHVQVNTVQTNEVPPTTRVTYQRLDGTDVLTVGEVIGADAPQRSQTIYNPPVRDRTFGLDVGQSTTVEYSGMTTVEGEGPRPDGPLVAHYAMTTNYVGQETITVPAGTFATCKFEQRMEPVFLSTPKTTLWIAKGKGVVVKRTYLSGGRTGTASLVEEALLPTSRLNGQPIAP